MSDRLQRALTYIEDHLAAPIELADIAAAAHLSSYHFARLFRASCGRAPMEYVRMRRLTEAALELRRNPKVSITELSLRTGFGSLQGFSAAFKREFRITPALYRNRQFALPIQEPIVMSTHRPTQPKGPEFRHHDAMTVAGLSTQFTQETKAEIPQLWGKFAPWIGQIPGQQGDITYGVCLPGGEGNFGYLAGVAVASGSDIPGELVTCEVPAARYAVFTHEGSLDFLEDTLQYIFGNWAPSAGIMLPGQPDFERYDDRFDPVTSTGAMEYWVPVTS